jgi:hypothetical protein
MTMTAATLFGVVLPAFAGGQPTLSEVDQIRPADIAPFDEFGRSVDIDGDRFIAGSVLDDSGAVDGGSAYVYVRLAGVWTEEFELLASTPATGDRFGHDVAIHGNTAAVGSPQGTPSSSSGQTGSVHVFVRSGTTWSLQQEITPAGAQPDDLSGWAVALQADRLLIGAPGTDVGSQNSGSVYVYHRNGTLWSEETRVEASNATANALFGYSVDLDGERAGVGALAGRGATITSGVGYVLRRSGTVWTEEARLAGTQATGNASAGRSVAIYGERAVVGAPTVGFLKGGATVFVRSGTTWTEQQWLASPASAVGDFFAWSVETVGGVVLLGEHAGPDGRGTGGVRLFRDPPGSWTEQAWLLPSDNVPNANDGGSERFGESVAASGETVIVGCSQDLLTSPSPWTGAVYVYSLGEFSSFCDAGDGSLASCPCGNPGGPTSGCDNAQATGGVELTIVDQEISIEPRATIASSGFPPSGTPPTVSIRSGHLDPLSPVVFGDGLRCLGTPIVRMGVTFAAGGEATHSFGHGAMGGTFYYQLWFRSAPGTFCAPGAFNLSSGRILTW